ncbi:MAG: hypothetical protein AAF725_03975 [Acidobacteriota bacterium]
MLLSQDMEELLELFEKRRVKYALVGGYAVNFYGYSRATQDLDLLVYPSIPNAQRIMAALDEFGFGEAGIPRQYFEQKGSAIHLGVEPNRIDLLTSLKSVDNDRIFQNSIRGSLGSVTVNIIAIDDLIEVKHRSERLRDRADAEELRRLERHSQP